MRDNAQLNGFAAANTALGRAGLPDDIGAAAAALLGPGGRWINGQRIEASGGMFLYSVSRTRIFGNIDSPPW